MDDEERIDGYVVKRWLQPIGDLSLARASGPAGDVELLFVPFEEAEQDPTFNEWFEDTICLARACRDPAWVPLADHSTSTRRWLAWEALPGLPLADLQRAASSQTGVALPLVVTMAVVVADALAELHALGASHGGRFASAVWFTPDGDVRLRWLRSALLPRLLRVRKTAPLDPTLAPEAIAGAVLDELRDVYALGAELWMLIAGRPLYSPTNTIELMRAIHDGPPPSLGSVRADAPPELVALIDAMLRKDPAARPTAQDVVDRLRHDVKWALWDADQVAAELRALFPGEPS